MTEGSTKIVHIFPDMHRTLAITSFISPAVRLPQSLDFFLGDGVVDIFSVGDIFMGSVCLME